MMDRRTFIGSVAGGLLAVPLVTVAQQAGKTYRIGILSGARRASEVDLVRSLSDLGYVQGRNTVFESRDGEGQAEKLRAFAEELARLKVDVVITAGGPAAEAAKRATKIIPIVVWGVGDPVGSGLVTDIAHPGGNITGVTELSTELTSKRLQLLKETLPGATRIAVLWNSTDVSMNLRYREAESAAPRLGLKRSCLFQWPSSGTSTRPSRR
jgi:putative ABC transport system substrate-binding protein